MHNNPVPSKPPKWWSPSAGIVLAAGITVLAALPYLSSVAKLLVDGKQITIAGLRKEADKEFRKPERAAKLREIKAIAVAADGTAWAGGKAGLFRREGTVWKLVDDYPGKDVKSLVVTGGDEVIAVDEKAVLQRSTDSTWRTIYDGESLGLALGPDGSALLTIKKGGVLRRAAGGTWEPWADGFPIETED